MTVQPIDNATPIVLGGTTPQAGALSLTQDTTTFAPGGLNQLNFPTIVIGGVFPAGTPGGLGGQVYSGTISTAGAVAAQANVTVETAGAVTLSNPIRIRPRTATRRPAI